MDYTIRYDETMNVVVVRTSGKLEMRDFPNLVDDIVVELQSRKSACLLADHSDSYAAELETQDDLPALTGPGSQLVYAAS